MTNPRAVVVAVVLLVGLSLAGCSASGSGSSAASGSAGSESGSRAAAGSPAAPVVKGAVDGAVKGAAVDRSIVVTGTVTITATHPVPTAEKAVALVEAAGGRVDSRTETAAANGDRGSATLVLRIPASKLSATLAALKKLGRADQVQLDSADVTSQSQDLDARITALRSTITRLLQLESTASDTTNLIALETAIGDRQGQLESLEAQQRGLADQVSMSTITLQLRSDAAAPPVRPADFWSGLSVGWAAFVHFWAVVLVVIGVLVPWIALTALALAVMLLALRVHRRRRRNTGALPQDLVAAGAPEPAATGPAPSA